jgi:hypothetical protein
LGNKKRNCAKKQIYCRGIYFSLDGNIIGCPLYAFGSLWGGLEIVSEKLIAFGLHRERRGEKRFLK